jgi:hypothetical protein
MGGLPAHVLKRNGRKEIGKEKKWEKVRKKVKMLFYVAPYPSRSDWEQQNSANEAKYGKQGKGGDPTRNGQHEAKYRRGERPEDFAHRVQAAIGCSSLVCFPEFIHDHPSHFLWRRKKARILNF